MCQNTCENLRNFINLETSSWIYATNTKTKFFLDKKFAIFLLFPENEKQKVGSSNKK